MLSFTFSFVFGECKESQIKTNKHTIQQTTIPNPNTQQTSNNNQQNQKHKKTQRLREIGTADIEEYLVLVVCSVLCLFPYVSTRNNKYTKGGPSPVCLVSFCVLFCICFFYVYLMLWFCMCWFPFVFCFVFCFVFIMFLFCQRQPSRQVRVPPWCFYCFWLKHKETNTNPKRQRTTNNFSMSAVPISRRLLFVVVCVVFVFLFEGVWGFGFGIFGLSRFVGFHLVLFVSPNTKQTHNINNKHL